MLAFQAGDEGAFEHIVSRYQSSVFHFILRTVGDRGRAEDLTQELFVRLYRSRRRYQPQAKFRTYLFTIASRLSSNELRARRRWRRVFVNPFRLQADMDEAPAGAEDGLVCLPGREETPAARLETQELEGVIHGLLAGLTPNQRAAIQLQQSETFSYREIAGILGVSTPAVKSLLVRAREKLRLGVESYLRGDRRSAPRAEGEKLAEDGSTRAETPGGENES